MDETWLTVGLGVTGDVRHAHPATKRLPVPGGWLYVTNVGPEGTVVWSQPVFVPHPPTWRTK